MTHRFVYSNTMLGIANRTSKRTERSLNISATRS